MQTYTVLRVTSEREVVLFEGHVRRLGEASRGALRSFAQAAVPGIYRVTWDGRAVHAEARGASRLVEGMPVRFVVSPYVDRQGRFAKPAPPSGYDAVRVAGVATLLTDALGREVYESCSASVVAWDGEGVVLPPEDTPGVASVAEAAVVARVPHRRARVLVTEPWPWVLINAVVGTCGLVVPGRAVFPPEVRARIDDALK